MPEHKWDMASDFCVRCGVAMEVNADTVGGIACAEGEQVIGISHRIARKREDERLAEAMAIAEVLRDASDGCWTPPPTAS